MPFSKGGNMRTWIRLAIAALSLAVVAVLAGLVFFKLIEKKIAGRFQPPELVAASLPAEDFSFQTLDGSPRRLSDFKGKVVFLNLWGTWCIQCVAEMPMVQRLYSHYQGDPTIEFLIVSRMDSPAAVRRYARLRHLDLPFYVTREEDIPASMYLHQYPATFIYAKHAGGADWSDPSVIRFIDQLKHH
jgi:thiol-disulfide isomerase/thioredoxin